MYALETTADISNHKLVIENATLPTRATHARVIVLWDAPECSVRNGHRVPPPALIGVGKEKGDIISSFPENNWEVLG